MSAFQQPEVISRSEVVRMGGLLPLTDNEIGEIAELVGLEPQQITKLPLYRIMPNGGTWTPSLKDFIFESMRELPSAHTRTVMSGFLTLTGVEEYATGKFRMLDPQTGELGEFTILYPYPDLRWAHTTCS